ncbi:isopentenyl-diphosphate Delta-isomerase [Curtobacterium sp. Csp1]|uniref:isopentenyl-diphosphate Delta-isomerase n=1 Tax=Curtobacterium sp. Csp1 TaxID=2495429 RepID=UPI0034A0C7BD
MNTFPETVVLLAEDRTPVGTADKFAVHTTDTPLHLAFSCHVRNTDGDVLVTRRALSKKTWPGVWTNTFCGHPGPDEAFEDAVARRASRELGITVRDVELVLPDFRYSAP